MPDEAIAAVAESKSVGVRGRTREEKGRREATLVRALAGAMCHRQAPSPLTPSWHRERRAQEKLCYGLGKDPAATVLFAQSGYTSVRCDVLVRSAGLVSARAKCINFDLGQVMAWVQGSTAVHGCAVGRFFRWATLRGHSGSACWARAKGLPGLLCGRPGAHARPTSLSWATQRKACCTS